MACIRVPARIRNHIASLNEGEPGLNKPHHVLTALRNPNTGTCPGGAEVRTPQCWFNASAFQQAQTGQFGNVGRNTLNGPAFQQWDFSAIKMIPIRESMNLQFPAQFFNIFNNVNFVLPNNDISSPNFGQIQAAQAGRVVQLALKFAF